MDKKTIMKMNDTWKDFRLTESAKLFKKLVTFPLNPNATI